MDVMLVMFKSDGKRQDFPLNKSRTIVGRKNNCDLRIPLSSVSRQHCELTIEGEQLRAKDLGSSNGTFHNGSRIQEAIIEAGDEITIGPVVFTAVIDGQPENIEPVKTFIGKPRENGDFAAPDSTTSTDHPTELPVESEDQLDTPMDPEGYSPTVDIDDAEDDPIAALERLAQAQEEADDDDKM
jgi:hypothetical protein